MNALKAPLPCAAKGWVNPVIVKELRQGIRSRLYALVFLSIQIVMLLYQLLTLANKSSSANTELELLFWWLVGMFLLVCLPLTGANALNTENRGSRLELLLLTGISARRIVYGKWLAIVAQGALLLTALLPYLVLRYYINSVEFHESLIYILLLLFGSAVFTGITVSLSVIRAGILRWFLLVFGGMFILPTMIGVASTQFYRLDMLYSSLPALLLTGLLLVMLCLEFAAARLNAIEGNHDTPKRLLLWALLAVASGSHFYNPDLGVPFIVALPAFALIAWDGLCRRPADSPAIYEPFVRRGWLGRLAGWLLYPGWPSAVFYNLFTFALICLLPFSGIFENSAADRWETLWFLHLAIGIYALPFAIVICIPFARRRIGLSMLIIQLALVMLTLLLHLIDKVVDIQTTIIVSWIPTCVFLLKLLADPVTDSDSLLLDPLTVSTTAVTFAALVVILFQGIRQRRFIRARQQQALRMLQIRKADLCTTPLPATKPLSNSPLADSIDPQT